MPLRHAAPSPPKFPNSLHRLAKEQSHRPPDFLSGHAYDDGKWEHRGDYAQEANPVRGICGAYRGHETAEMRDVRRNGGGRVLRGGAKKRVGVSWTTLEISVSTQTIGRLQPRTRGNVARRWDVGWNVS